MKFFQITSSDGVLFGLDGDGQIWRGTPTWDSSNKWTWIRVPMPSSTEIHTSAGYRERMHSISQRAQDIKVALAEAEKNGDQAAAATLMKEYLDCQRLASLEAKRPDALPVSITRTDMCTHYQWTDLEHGVGQCRQCMQMLPYAAFGCAPDEA